MKKVLIITYYWPPSGGSPVLRWLNFVKYLSEYGWEATIFTPENPEPQATDVSLLGEIPEGINVIKTKIWEPYQFFKFLSGRKNQKNLSTALISENSGNGLLSRLFIWVRGNFFIPDARMFWIRPSYRFLKKYLNDHPHDLIISTGPPHSLHLIAQKIKTATGIPWLADFRDPWTNIDYYHELNIGRWANAKHHYYEQKVLLSANKVITVSPTMTAEFVAMGCRNIETITNGFDAVHKEELITHDPTFTLLHVGSMPKSRNPDQLWKVLGKLAKENSEFEKQLKIELIGSVDFSIIKSIQEAGLENNLVQKPHLPNQSVLKRMHEVTVLLLVVNNTPNSTGILTNKFFEYLSVKRPILAVGPKNGDLASILNECEGGKIFDYNENEDLESHILELYQAFLSGKLIAMVKNIDKFSRRNLTAQLSHAMNSIAK